MLRTGIVTLHHERMIYRLPPKKINKVRSVSLNGTAPH